MTKQKSTWQSAIVSVLQHADKPLDYKEITKIIGERGLRTLTGPKPSNTVRATLTHMTNTGHWFYDERIRNVGPVRGGRADCFQFVSSGDVTVPEQEPDDLDGKEQDSNPDLIVGVPAYALYWDRYKVYWGNRTSGQILGQQNQ